MSVKLGFNFDNKASSLNQAISSITIEDLDVIEHEVEVLEDIVTSRSKQLEDHVSMLESVTASIVAMEEEENSRAIAREEQIAEKERLQIERAQSLEEKATSLSNNVTELDTMVAIKEDKLSKSVEVQLELKLDLDTEFASWYNINVEYFSAQTIYTKANILQSELAEVIAKQEVSIRLHKELALKDNVTNLLALIQAGPATNDFVMESWMESLKDLKEEALKLGLYSSKQPGEIVKHLKMAEEALWELEKAEVKEDIEALVSSMEEAESVDKDKISSFREEIKQLQDDAKEYNLYKDLLHAWQILDKIKPEELQEQENQRHARRLVKEEEQKSTSVIAHALSEAEAEAQAGK